MAAICIPSGVTVVEVAVVDVPLQSIEAVASDWKFLPLMVSWLPPWQTVAGVTESTSGGGSMVRVTTSLEEQSAGAGLVTTTGTLVGEVTGKSPTLMVMVMLVQSSTFFSVKLPSSGVQLEVSTVGV